MPPVLTVIRWRDIPAQVIAKDGRAAARRVLPDRFHAAIDRAAMRAGLVSESDYVGEWMSDREPCDGDLEAAVAARAEAVERAHPQAVLDALVENGGWRDRAGGVAQEPDA
jgi:Virulence factor